MDGQSEAKAFALRTMAACASKVAALLDKRDADCDRVALVCGDSNAHALGTFYEAYEPKRVRQFVRRIQFRRMAKDGSWLNFAEFELRLLKSRCPGGRRTGYLELLQTKMRIWSEKRNANQRGVD